MPAGLCVKPKEKGDKEGVERKTELVYYAWSAGGVASVPAAHPSLVDRRARRAVRLKMQAPFRLALRLSWRHQSHGSESSIVRPPSAPRKSSVTWRKSSFLAPANRSIGFSESALPVLRWGMCSRAKSKQAASRRHSAAGILAPGGVGASGSGPGCQSHPKARARRSAALKSAMVKRILLPFPLPAGLRNVTRILDLGDRKAGHRLSVFHQLVDECCPAPAFAGQSLSLASRTAHNCSAAVHNLALLHGAVV